MGRMTSDDKDLGRALTVSDIAFQLAQQFVKAVVGARDGSAETHVTHGVVQGYTILHDDVSKSGCDTSGNALCAVDDTGGARGSCLIDESSDFIQQVGHDGCGCGIVSDVECEIFQGRGVIVCTLFTGQVDDMGDTCSCEGLEIAGGGIGADIKIGTEGGKGCGDGFDSATRGVEIVGDWTGGGEISKV